MTVILIILNKSKHEWKSQCFFFFLLQRNVQTYCIKRFIELRFLWLTRPSVFALHGPTWPWFAEQLCPELLCKSNWLNYCWCIRFDDSLACKWKQISKSTPSFLCLFQSILKAFSCPLGRARGLKVRWKKVRMTSERNGELERVCLHSNVFVMWYFLTQTCPYVHHVLLFVPI